jgi:hypothetical protein
MKSLPHVIVFRVVTVTITVLILLTAGFGLASHGPLGSLGARTSQANQLVHDLYAKGWLG